MTLMTAVGAVPASGATSPGCYCALWHGLLLCHPVFSFGIAVVHAVMIHQASVMPIPGIPGHKAVVATGHLDSTRFHNLVRLADTIQMARDLR